jgi:hypothetical protein
MKSFAFLGFAAFALGIVLLSPHTAAAAAYTWDGGGATNNWSECANWSSNLCPGATDVVTFNAVSTKSAIIDVSTMIQSLNMNAGYTGVITQSADLTLSQNFNHHTSDGTFAWSTGKLTFSGGSVTIWNQDTGDDSFGAVDINKNHNTPVAITSNESVSINGDLRLINGYIQTTLEGAIYASSINARGNVFQESGFDGVDEDGTSFIHFINLDFSDDAVSQTYTVNGGIGPWVRLDSAADASDAIIFVNQGELTGVETTTGFAGNIPITNPGDVPVTVWHWNQTAGDYDASLQSDWGFAEFSVSPGASFVAPILVRATRGGNYNWEVDGSQTFNDFTISKTDYGSIHIGNGTDTLVVLGDLRLVDGGFWDGVIDVRGDIYQFATYVGGAGRIDFGDDLVAQTYTADGGGTQTLRFDSVADASDSLVLASSTGVAVEVTSGFSGVIPVLNPLNVTPSFWLWSQAAGIYDASAQTNWNIDALSITGGTFIAPATVTAWRGASTWDVNVSQTFNDLVVNRDGLFRSVTLAGNDTLIVNGDLSLLDGKLGYAVTPSTGSVRVRGDVLVGPLWDGGNVAIRFIGSGVQTFDLTGATSLFEGDVVVNKSGGQVELLSDLIMDYATIGLQDLTIQRGTLDVGSTGNYSISLNGNWSNSGTFQARQGQVNFIGATQRITGTTSFYNLTKSSTSPATLILATGRTQTILGNLNLSGGVTGILTVRSSSAGTQASLDAQGTRTLEYLKVKDNNNVNLSTMTCGAGCVDLGNNFGWVF